METSKKLELAKYIDHTLLKPESTRLQIENLCSEAIQYSFKGVCINSNYCSLVASLLKGTEILVVTVIGFPLGACLSEVKRFEAEQCVLKGANEIDMVLNLGAAKDELWSSVEKDIKLVTKNVPVPVKVILETGLLSNDQIINACKAAEAAGARFVKTCTGFGPGIATVEHIELMRDNVSSKVEIKASGGIKSFEQAQALINAGATRLGTSSGVQLITGQLISPKNY